MTFYWAYTDVSNWERMRLQTTWPFVQIQHAGTGTQRSWRWVLQNALAFRKTGVR